MDKMQHYSRNPPNKIPLPIYTPQEFISISSLNETFSKPFIIRGGSAEGLLPLWKKNNTKALFSKNFREFMEPLNSSTVQTLKQGSYLDFNYDNIPKEDIITSFNDGTLIYSSVDHFITPENDPTSYYKNPPYFTDRNIYHKLNMKCDSIIISPANNYTQLHTDDGGAGSTMVLIKGKKSWQLIDPIYRAMLFDFCAMRFYDPITYPHPNSKYQEQLNNIPRWVGDISDYDILYFPDGSWLHCVWSHEACYGICMSLTHEAKITEAIKGWWFDKLCGFAPFDYLPLIRELEGATGHKCEKETQLINDLVNVANSRTVYKKD